MVTKIIGIIWILAGGFGIIRPEFFKKRVQKQLSKRVRRIVIFFLLALGFILAGSIFKAKNFLTLIAGIVGAVIVIKVILMITNKTSEKIFEWFKIKPILFFRIWAFLIFVFGIVFLNG